MCVDAYSRLINQSEQATNYFNQCFSRRKDEKNSYAENMQHKCAYRTFLLHIFGKRFFLR